MINGCTSCAGHRKRVWDQCATKLGVFGGNNAGSMHQAAGGIRPVGISMPCRYLHTPSCVLQVADITATYDLLMKLSEAYAVCD